MDSLGGQYSTGNTSERREHCRKCRNLAEFSTCEILSTHNVQWSYQSVHCMAQEFTGTYGWELHNMYMI